MQVRQSHLQSDRPVCPVNPKHPIHAHGHYSRYGNCNDQKRVWVLRWLCYFCRRTISVLLDGLLPYRAVSCQQLQQYFDAQAAEQPPPPATEKERGCLKRAWRRFGQRVDALATVLGQLMQLRQRSAKQCWQQLRRLGNLPEILRLLGRPFKTSLLHDYCCLLPWSLGS